ncbi:MAG: carboxypeptidase-like regulatory domain-containing protein, partial [Terracidiphilus sp.]
MTRKISLIMGALAVFMLAAVLGGTAASAQGNSATLTGTVNDPSLAVIPGATIAVTDEASGVVRTTTSDSAGFFSMVGLPVGTYDVKVSAPGFNSLLRKGVEAHINDQIELKGIALTIAGANATVTVTATDEEMTPTTSGELSYTLSDTQL